MIFKYSIDKGAYSINFCPLDILKPIFFSVFFIFVNVSKNFILCDFVYFIFFSNHLFFFLTNCFIGSASKNSFETNILGKFFK